MNQYITQGIGFAALVFVVMSFQKNSRKFTLVTLCIASLLFCFHYIRLDAHTGAALNLAGALRAFVFYFREKNKILAHPSFMWIFIFIFIGAGTWTYNKPADVFPVIAMVIECFALWNRNTRYIRYLFITARPPWFIYNTIEHSLAGMATEVFLTISLLTAMYRFDMKKSSV